MECLGSRVEALEEDSGRRGRNVGNEEGQGLTLDAAVSDLTVRWRALLAKGGPELRSVVDSIKTHSVRDSGGGLFFSPPFFSHRGLAAAECWR